MRKAQNNSKYRFYEFFAGAGMARLGLEPDWDCLWANDNDPKKVEIYEHLHGVGHIDSRDISIVSDSIITDHRVLHGDVCPPFPRGADMAWASFPCQDLSLAGRQRGMSAKRSGAYWPFWSILYELMKTGERPPVVVLENVKGLLYGNSFRGLCESLVALNMRFGAIVLDAKHFVPQSRPRVFVVAVDADMDLSGLELKSSEHSAVKPNALREAFDILPNKVKEKWVWWDLGRLPVNAQTFSEFFLPDPNDVKYDPQPRTKRLLSLMSPCNRSKVQEAERKEGLQIGLLYRRTREGQQRAEVRFDGLAGCLRTPRGGSSRQVVVVVQGRKVRTRLLSRIEAARLMGIQLDNEGWLPEKGLSFFPPGFSYNDSYMALGDGVVVPAVKYLNNKLLLELAKRGRESCLKGKSQGKQNCKHSKNCAHLKNVDRHIAAVWRLCWRTPGN